MPFIPQSPIKAVEMFFSTSKENEREMKARRKNREERKKRGDGRSSSRGVGIHFMKVSRERGGD